MDKNALCLFNGHLFFWSMISFQQTGIYEKMDQMDRAGIGGHFFASGYFDIVHPYSTG